MDTLLHVDLCFSVPRKIFALHVSELNYFKVCHSADLLELAQISVVGRLECIPGPTYIGFSRNETFWSDSLCKFINIRSDQVLVLDTLYPFVVVLHIQQGKAQSIS